MFSSRAVLSHGLLQSSSTAARRSMSKVAVLGASGGIGQPLSLLLKLSPLVSELSCYDVVGTPGVAADLSHVRKKKRRLVGLGRVTIFCRDAE
jgi:malate dehydrogenase